MKKGLAIIFVLLLCSPLFAQRDTTFYDNNWEEIKNSDTASYYRLLNDYNKSTGVYHFSDYFITGELQATCSYTDKDGKKGKSGEFIWYYINGQVWQKGTYLKGKAIGPWYEYFDNGDMKHSYTYDLEKGKNGPYKKDIDLYDEKSREHIVIDGEGIYVSYFKNGDTSLTGLVKGGLCSGTWTAYRENGKLLYIEEYKQGVLQSGVGYDKEGKKHKYTESETMPSYKGGQEELLKYIGTIVYPTEAREKDLEGTVYVQFVVDKEGYVVEAVAIRSSGHSLLDDAAVAHIKKSKQWIPGQQKGLPVRVQYVVPIKFKLGGNIIKEG